MRFLGPGRAGNLPTPFVAVVFAVVLASGCASTEAYRYGSGAFALNGAECNQTDSTVTCCLKQHPGQYELCGATPPARSEPINVGPPGLRSLEDGEKEEARDDNEETQEDREKRCADYYARCIEEIGKKPGSLYGTTQCRDCFGYCARHGFWPERMNKKKCPGA
ncbi:hypothetical protein [Archangium violaceum]|uniref:hypothetical protein n=1 Tax=Archangium violaceum TaxID=83451 RepID=UPI001269FAF5|nr:hypothetical protein [Archangium violaceum]